MSSSAAGSKREGSDHLPGRPAIRGLSDAATLLPAIAPLGFALGAAMAETSAPRLVSWLSAPLMVAGSAQVVLLGQLDHGEPALAAAATATLVNARFVVYGAAMARRFAGQPAWFRFLGAHFVVDQTYGLVSARGGDPPAWWFRRWFVGSGALLALVWTLTVGAGVLLGPLVPGDAPLEFVLPAMFVALVAPQLRSGRLVAAAVAGLVVGLAGWPPTASLLAAAAAGALAGAPIEAGGER